MPSFDQERTAKRILVAESDGAIRSVIRNFLSMYYTVEAAATSDEAAEMLRRNDKFDLVLVDTHLIPMNGITFAGTSLQIHSALKFAVMTKARVEDLFPALNKYGLHNVIVKTAPFEFDDFLITVENLLYPQRAVGLGRYLRDPKEVRQSVIITKSDRQGILQDAVAFFRRYRPYDTDVGGIRLAFEELINNAVFHAFRKRAGGEKYDVSSFATLNGEEQITMEYGRDNTYLGCSVSDNQGTLEIGTVTSKMERQISMEGLLDESGRGLYLTRTLCDKMIVNVKPGKMTQIILLFANRARLGPKPLTFNLITDVRPR